MTAAVVGGVPDQLSDEALEMEIGRAVGQLAKKWAGRLNAALDIKEAVSIGGTLFNCVTKCVLGAD